MRHHAGMSAGAPGSRATSRKSSPGPRAERRKRSSSTSSPQPSSPASHWAATLATRPASGCRHAALVDLLEGSRVEAPRRCIVEDAAVPQSNDAVRIVAGEADLVEARDDRHPLGRHRAKGVEHADGVETPERLLTIRLHEAAGEDSPRGHGGEPTGQHVFDAAQPANEVELLEDHGDLAPRRAEIAPAETTDVASVDLDH